MSCRALSGPLLRATFCATVCLLLYCIYMLSTPRELIPLHQLPDYIHLFFRYRRSFPTTCWRLTSKLTGGLRKQSAAWRSRGCVYCKDLSIKYR